MTSRPASSRTVPLDDGRQLGTAEYGVPNGLPVLFFHGTPASRHQALPLAEVATVLGIRLVAVERPGFGASTPAPGRGFREWPADVVQLMDGLGVSSAPILAVSGGAAFALACAAARQERFPAALLVSGAGIRRGGSVGIRLQRRVVRHLPGLAERAMAKQLDPRRVDDRARTKAMAMMSPADLATAARPDVQAWMVEERAERFAHGVAPAVAEMRAYTRPWGFDLADVRVPVTLLHGDDDRTVPLSAAEALARALPQATLEVVPGTGHALLLQAPERVRAALAALAGIERRVA